MHPELIELWLPILVATIAVFIVSSLIWTVIGWHNSDWKELPDEDSAWDVLKGVPQGQYSLPYARDGKAKQDPEWQAKAKEGPAAMITIWDGDTTKMGKQLTQWFVYILVITVILAYVTSKLVHSGESFLMVFHSILILGALTYSGAPAMGSIWFGHSWGRTIKDIVDGIIYAAVTAAVMAWLWPGVPEVAAQSS